LLAGSGETPAPPPLPPEEDLRPLPPEVEVSEVVEDTELFTLSDSVFSLFPSSDSDT